MTVRSIVVNKASAASAQGIPAHLVPVWTRAWFRELISELFKGRSSPHWTVCPLSFHVVDFCYRNVDGVPQFATESGDWVAQDDLTSLMPMQGEKAWVDMLSKAPPMFGIAASADLQRSASALHKVSCSRGPSLRISGKDVVNALAAAASPYPEENEPRLVGWNGAEEVPLRLPVEFYEIGHRHTLEAAKTLVDLHNMDAICLDVRQLFYRLF